MDTEELRKKIESEVGWVFDFVLEGKPYAYRIYCCDQERAYYLTVCPAEHMDLMKWSYEGKSFKYYKSQFKNVCKYAVDYVLKDMEEKKNALDDSD